MLVVSVLYWLIDDVVCFFLHDDDQRLERTKEVEHQELVKSSINTERLIEQTVATDQSPLY